MAIGFGSSLRDDSSGDSSYWDGHNIGYTNGLISGTNSGVEKCQLIISQNPSLSHEQKKALWKELEQAKWK